MNFYMMWTAPVFIFYLCYYYLSKQNQLQGGMYFWVVLALGAFPGWALVSRYSKHLLFDGLLYDAILISTYPIMMYFMGEMKKFSTIGYVGLVFVIIGLIMMKISVVKF